ncbi:ABC transporter substrate-binding protein [Aliikangiella sp. G2MR2-5]|uniref:substrate-binding periplasmic protein n=1 Tax=Aliikangiella sp. G2MR2-5 TaxID=2788943 RepID=UPI0018ABB9D3|nr:transporter substrate-binding domain-containing protein [Aliikangiella sp. G2MR2-5]
MEKPQIDFKLSGLIFVLVVFSVTNIALASERQPPTVSNKSLEKKDQNCVLHYGFTEWKPLQYVNAQGKPTGTQFLLTQNVVKALGCELKITFGPWDSHIRNIKNGSLDFLSNATFSEERNEFALFSEPYRKDEFAIFVRQEDIQKYKNKSLTELMESGFRLGVGENYVYGKRISDIINNPKYTSQLPGVYYLEENIEKLNRGEIDGLLDDPLVISYKMRTKEIPYKLISLKIKAFGAPVSFMFSRKNFDESFMEKFNAVLKKTSENKEY